VIYYNKALFDEAGIPYPKSGWTLEDLRQAALKLTEKNGDDITQYGFAYEPDEWWRLWVWLKGGELYDNDFSPTRLLLDSPEAIGALQWLSDLTNVDRVTPPYEIQKTSLNIGQLFQDGKLAMCFGNHALIPAFAAKSSLKWDVVGIPAGKTRLNAAGGSGYVIPANSKNKEAAWTFLKWLESSKGQAIFTETGVIVPARRSVGHADIFLKQDPPHNASVFLEETERGRPNPMFKGIQGIQSALNESLVPLWQGKVSAETAVRDLVPRVNLALNKN
jgi:multiple sugar transport system substrate-binding protein